ncbi:cysteine desulfurase / selenocysteine lyase [Arboricoccus pini]|uniref:cysteine desulfurase n=1 Tax=Arboricoccus pini TaxID=1963835 RepID=A0A212QTN5_9PROT|nr:aminotransferase class V-fold PLP-dependent enzyme [Arboricoccus pini]SNB62975.1 cysteine desulfurase / selenocysteine lyase [Arboricoccus pini]
MSSTLKKAFPIFASRTERFHYLDSAATGQICAAAAAALLGYETTARANVKRGVYPLADAASNAFDAARASIARYIGIDDANEVIFTSGTTMGLNLLAHCLTAELAPGDEILLSELEHHSNIVPWQIAAARRSLIVRAIPVKKDGTLELAAIEGLLSARTRIIAVAHTSNVTGAISDTSRIAEAARAAGAYFVLDGAQALPHGPVDLKRLGCDAFAASGHKMFSATGAGIVWMNKELAHRLPPFLSGGEMIRTVSLKGSTYAPPPHRFEAGTPPIGACLAMGAAAEWLASLDWTAIESEERRLTRRLLDGLSATAHTTVLGPAGFCHRRGIISFDVDGVHPHDLCQFLGDRGIALRGGHHCAQPLMERFNLAATTRASLALYNDDADIDALLEGLESAVRLLR